MSAVARFVARVAGLDLERTRRWVIAGCCLFVGSFAALAPGASSTPGWATVKTLASPVTLGIALVAAGLLILAPGHLARMVGAATAAGVHVFLAATFTVYAWDHHWTGIVAAGEIATVATAALFLLFSLTKSTTRTARGA